MKAFSTAVALALISSHPVMAADRLFDLIGISGKSAVFIDANSKQQSGLNETFWILLVNPPAALITAQPNLHYVVSKLAIDCNFRTTQTLSTVGYGKSDDLIFSQSAPTAAVDIKPGTLADTQYKYVCLNQRFMQNFKMLPHLKEAVAYADEMTKPPSDAPTPND